jgi:hypothetical protein
MCILDVLVFRDVSDVAESHAFWMMDVKSGQTRFMREREPGARLDRAQRLQRLDEMTPKAFRYTRVDVTFVRLWSSCTLQVPSMALGR